jgi:DNA-binding NarL/FixJ family response regulator
MRVVVADDHHAMRQSICRWIAEQPNLEVVGQAVNGHEAVLLARELVPDIILMDVNMPCLDGMAATRQITRDFPAIRVVAMSIDWNKTEVANMLQVGALDCVSKADSWDMLLKAIETVSSGECGRTTRVPAQDV